jgi:hypothetical protein
MALTGSSSTSGNSTPQTPNGILNLGRSAKASVDPSGYSELKDIYQTTSDQLKAMGGQNDYRTPEKVYDPDQSPEMGTENVQSLQDRAFQYQAYGAMGDQAGPNAYYKGLMNGTAPSLAEQQMQQGVAQAQAQGMAAAGGARGINRAAAFRNAQNQASNAAVQGAIAGGQQRMQEQQLGGQGLSQGIQAQSNMAQGLRSSDVGEQQGVMGLENQAQSNLNQQMQINAGITTANAANKSKGVAGVASSVLGALSDIGAKEDIRRLTPGVQAQGSQGKLAAALQMAPMAPASQPQSGGDLLNEDQSKNVQAGLSKLFGGGGSTATDAGGMGGGMGSSFGGGNDATSAAFSGAGIGSAGGEMGGGLGIGSDEKIKTGIHTMSKEALDPVDPYEFSYKDAFADHMARDTASANPKISYASAFQDAKEPRVGVMAQDLEKSPEGKSVVKDTSIGKMIDGKRAMGFLLATQADINHRLSRLEGRA